MVPSVKFCLIVVFEPHLVQESLGASNYLDENALFLHLFLGYVVGGTWIALIAWFGELRGSRLGGFVAGLPSTVALGFLFIGWNQSAAIAVEATTTFPLFYSFAGVFLLSFAAIAGKLQNFWRALIISIVIWLAFTSLVALADVQIFEFCLIACILISLGVYSLFTKKLVSPRKVSDRRSTWFEAALRFFIGGGIVALAVLTSQLAGPEIGVIPTAFPAISCASLYVLNRTHGLEFSRAFAMPIMVTAMLTVVPFAVAVRVLYPLVGIWFGTLGAYLIAIPFAIIAFLILHPETRILTKVAWR